MSDEGDDFDSMMQAFDESAQALAGGGKQEEAKQPEVLDFATKNNYAEYNQALQSIPDDPAGLPQMLKDLKAAHRRGVTGSCEYRVQQLQSLKKGVEEMGQELCEAVGKDLGKGPDMVDRTELNLIREDL